ncbi:unnamed protein product [Sphagnum tenellum]
MANVFTNAPAAPAPKKSAKKADKATVPVVALEEFGSISAVIKTLKTMLDTIETEVKTGMKEHFVKEGQKSKKRPENFKGVDGFVTASCELRARSSASHLSGAEQELLEKYKIPTETVKSQEETFIVNPAYANDGALLQKVGDAIGKIKDLPADFILKQEAVSKVIVADTALDFLFANQTDTNVLSTLVSIVGTLAIKPTVGDMAEALEIVEGVLFPNKKAERLARKVATRKAAAE